MATGNINVMESGLADLDKLLQSLEIENKQQQYEIKKEQQQAAVFEAATEKEKSFKTLQEDTARLNEETKAGHQQFRHNRETYQSLKSHHLALVLNQETAQKDLQELHDKWQVEKPQHERALQHYESIWEQYKAKYEEREPAVKLRKWQQQLAETKERLEDSKGKVKVLESVIHENHEKRKTALKPFKSRNQWIIKLLLQRESFPTMFYTINSSPLLVTKATVWAETRQKRTNNEKIHQSIRETERKIQEKKERQLQKAQLEEQERKRKVREAEDKKRLEDQERQKQQQLHQQKQLQQLKEQQQQNQQKLLQQQHRQQQPEHMLSPPQRIPQSPLQQPATARTTQSQYFQSPLIGHAPSRSTAAVSQQQPRIPPYLQMPIMASPRQSPVSTSNFSCSTPSYAPQLFTLKMPSESSLKNQRQPQQKLPSANACIPTRHDGRAPLSQPVPTRKGGEISREQESQQANQVSSHTSQIRRDEPAKGNRESELLVEQPGDKEMMEERHEISGIVGSSDTLENPPQTPIEEANHAEDPSEATSGAFQPPMSPFDLEAHFQNLNEMAKSPGFTFSCRPMFNGEDVNDDISESSHPSAAFSSSDNFSSRFLQPFFNQPDDSPMEVGPSRPQEGGVLSLFGGGQDQVNKPKDDQEESSATAFSFNFTSSSPNVKSPSAKKFLSFLNLLSE